MSEQNNILKRAVKILADIEPNEVKATVWSFMFVFMLMTAYYPLRNVRDAMPSDWTDAELSWLWTLNFFISIVVIALYGYVVSKVKFKNLVPGIYGFFCNKLRVFNIRC